LTLQLALPVEAAASIKRGYWTFGFAQARLCESVRRFMRLFVLLVVTTSIVSFNVLQDALRMPNKPSRHHLCIAKFVFNRDLAANHS
jgi:hypothetical protein